MTVKDPTLMPFGPRGPRPAAGEGYLDSSLDLQAGLRVRELLVSACPPEVVRELARMRRSWGPPAHTPMPALPAAVKP